MLRITICVGSSCSVHGADEVAARLEQCVERENLRDQIELVGAFCMEQCSNGVSIKIEDRCYKVPVEGVEHFFYEKVWPLVTGREAEGRT